MIHGHYTKSKFPCPQIKFYWNISMPVCLCIVYGCLHTAIAESEQLQLRVKWPIEPKIFTI